MRKSFSLNAPQLRHISHTEQSTEKTPLYTTHSCLLPQFPSQPTPLRSALPVHVFLPVIWGWRSICIRASKHDVPLALVHHAARLLVVVERHRRRRHRLHIDGDIGLSVRRNRASENGTDLRSDLTDLRFC